MTHKVANAMQMARAAWSSVSAETYDERAFIAALNAYTQVMAERSEQAPQIGKSIEANPENRTPAQHFLSICNQYPGYVMTDGRHPFTAMKKAICYQPDARRSKLVPLFIEVLEHDRENIVDARGRPLIQEISHDQK